MWRKVLCCFTAAALMFSCSMTSLAADLEMKAAQKGEAVNLPAKIGETGRQELLLDQAMNAKSGRALTLERFSVSSVEIHPVYFNPEKNGYYYFDNIGYKKTGKDQTNWLDISPASTQKLLDDLKAKTGQPVAYWEILVQCKVENISRPDCYVYHYLYGDQTSHTEGAMVNPSRPFVMTLPILDTTEPYENGVRGVFYYYNSNGRYLSAQMGGGVTLNSTYSEAK